MSSDDKARAETERLFSFFQAQGAVPVETALLQPAGTLLDLYGEDIRARAYVTDDVTQGEMMLRPDFTVPVVQKHMAGGSEPARYTYTGKVFRQRSEGSQRPTEHVQVGYEVFARTDPAAADAEVFAMFSQVLKPLNLRVSTGDIGILTAAVAGLSTSEDRKAALLRHIWRPRRFRALLDRYSGVKKPCKARNKLLKKLAKDGVDAVLHDDLQDIGLRHKSEVAARLEVLRADAQVAPLPQSQQEALSEILALRVPSPEALGRLQDISVDLPSLVPALERFEARLDALAARGINVDDLWFEASFGRTTLEYYDGFVFGFHAEARSDLPAIASGGRYDALTRVLGQGRSIPAVGGVIRPELVAELGG